MVTKPTVNSFYIDVCCLLIVEDILEPLWIMFRVVVSEFDGITECRFAVDAEISAVRCLEGTNVGVLDYSDGIFVY